MIRKIFLPATAALLILGSGCSKSDDDNTTPVVTHDPALIVNTAMQGSWIVTKYIDHTDDETHHFTGYVFTFGASNVLTATNGVDTVTGSWSVTDDQSGDDSPSDSVDFNILFVAPPDFEDISDDWDIISISENKIEMIDVSGNSSNTDYITFERT